MGLLDFILTKLFNNPTFSVTKDAGKIIEAEGN